MYWVRHTCSVEATCHLKGHDGPHAVPEEGERSIRPRCNHFERCVSQGANILNTGLGAPVLAPRVLYGENINRW